MMGAGQAVLIWVIASGLACILLLCWAVITGLGAGLADKRHRILAFALLAVTAVLAVLPTGVSHLRHAVPLPFSVTLFLGASLCLFAAIAVLFKLRRIPPDKTGAKTDATPPGTTPANTPIKTPTKTSADLGIAACLNLWLALLMLLTPLPYL
ncbi:hypothetical protein SAMN05216227_102442 [Pseudorhodobacter antarcticus]|jgi:hypothetical protein|uniref:Uncharacterized protein n=1 Tax=Pseudorhodobacter antarcticus TaxID=1077947 RepID=A0A1H8JCJ1_9RHOB|nr:hypothetical protein [Pseudorhodobacter antarcticus]SEN78046.1 hypothetical protein SAMN05216227_102442 [Pseudorhodobacter antarcticus]